VRLHGRDRPESFLYNVQSKQRTRESPMSIAPSRAGARATGSSERTPRGGAAATPEKKPSLRAVWPMVRKLITPRRGMLALGFLLMAVNRVTGLVLPASTKWLIDDVIGKREVQLLLPLVALLVRDRNKLVASAAIRNPKIGDAEIEGYARSRQLSDEVIRIISNNRQWTRNYGVKRGLVMNPKCPSGSAIKFLNFLTDRDLGAIMRSRDVPGPISSQARRILARKGKK